MVRKCTLTSKVEAFTICIGSTQVLMSRMKALIYESNVDLLALSVIISENGDKVSVFSVSVLFPAD